MIVPRLVIAGTQSGVGKTTMALAILAALKDRGPTLSLYAGLCGKLKRLL